MGDRITVRQQPREAELSWEDTEDQLRGLVVPASPRAGDVVSVTVDVGSFTGRPFDGPVTFQWRRAGETHGESVTAPHQRGWHAEFHPDEPGAYSLDVSFLTSRLKLLHATVGVRPAETTDFWWAAVAAAVALGAGYAVRRTVKNARAERQREKASAEALNAPVGPPPENAGPP